MEVNVDFSKTGMLRKKWRSRRTKHIVPPKSTSNTLKNSSNKREQKGGHLLTKQNYIVKRDTP